MELGIRVKDKITGFVGVVTGFVQYISGCNQVLVAPPVDKDGKRIDSEWFDVQRLERVDDSKVTLDNADHAGADSEPPKR
ncbi:MAG: hypothetical protein ACJ8C4_00580 [Gemmataceae bacterium]